MKKVHLVCAARPNFMKIAPLYHALIAQEWCEPLIIHTGQHYDYSMSQAFFDDLGLPDPHQHLGVGSGSHAVQTAQTMINYEQFCLHSPPDLVIVVGDVNATLSCTIAAKKLHLPVAHLEAGLRSFDRTMPEEINRIVTDSICDYHWVPSLDATENLLHEGVVAAKINFVGNIMIDSYCMMLEKIKSSNKCAELGLADRNFVVMTLHRPVNVDNIHNLQNILNKLAQIDLPIVFPVHPRTKKNLDQIESLPVNLRVIEPLSYVDFMQLVTKCAFVISDSGGVQEETTYLNIPCYTLRETTERPVTVTMGSNQLVTVDSLLEKIKTPKLGQIPPLWDGNTAARVCTVIQEMV